MSANGLLSELNSIQRLLSSRGVAAPTDGAPLQFVPSLAQALHPALAPDSDDEEDGSEGPALQAARSANQEQLQRLQREAESLRVQLRTRQEECERLQATAAREREESGLVIERLQAALLQQRAEGHELSELALTLKGENDALQQQLQSAESQANKIEQDTASSVQQLSAAARQWRKQHEEVMRQLVQEQEQEAVLRSELRLLREQQQQLEEALEAERREHNRAAAKCTALEAMFQSHGKQQAANEELVTELKNRLKTERTWRKATQAWLKAELHTKDELERLLVNVSTSVRLNTHAGQPQLQAAKPRGLGTAVQQQQQPGLAPPASATVTGSPAVASARGVGAGVPQTPPAKHPGNDQSPAQQLPAQQAGIASCEQASNPPSAPQLGAAAPLASDWRSNFDATLASFEARYNRLQEELAAAKSVAGQPPL